MQTLLLQHLSCQNCVKHVTEHLSALEGVSQVRVDLEEQTARVVTDREYSLSDYQQALEDTIYEVVELK